MVTIAKMCGKRFEIRIDETPKYDVPCFYVVDTETEDRFCIQVNGPAYMNTGKFLTNEQKNCLMTCLKKARRKNWIYMIDQMIERGYKNVYDSTKNSIPYYQYM